MLAIAGHDPSGAAGVQADIETISACGARCATLITVLTAQNTSRFAAVRPQRAEDLREQAQLLQADMEFAACKVGLLGNAAIANIVADVLAAQRHVPIVLDPVLRTGTGVDVADRPLLEVLEARLIAMCTIITPNHAEALALTGCVGSREAAQHLLETGVHAVLITGADDDTPAVINTLYRRAAQPVSFEFPRLPGVYHGSGCTLSASLAAFLALGMDLHDAVQRAQEFTWKSLRAGRKIGRGQLHPDRFAAIFPDRKS